MSVELKVVRLKPGSDLRLELEAQVKAGNLPSGFILGLIGSLSKAQIRLAGESTMTHFAGPLEICSAQGTLTQDGAHLHLVVSDKSGKVVAGHLCVGSIVHTTVEFSLITSAGLILHREFDEQTGFKELVSK